MGRAPSRPTGAATYPTGYGAHPVSLNVVVPVTTRAIFVAPLRQSIRSILQGRFGKEATALTAFGFSPAKPPKKTAETKAAAAVKTAATREARHTMGRVQKKTVKGDVVAIAVTPLVASPPQPASGASAPSSPTPSPSPSPASPAATSPAQTGGSGH